MWKGLPPGSSSCLTQAQTKQNQGSLPGLLSPPSPIGQRHFALTPSPSGAKCSPACPQFKEAVKIPRAKVPRGKTNQPGSPLRGTVQGRAPQVPVRRLDPGGSERQKGKGLGLEDAVKAGTHLPKALCL